MKPDTQRKTVASTASRRGIPPLTEDQLRSFRRVTPEQHERFRKALEGTFDRAFPSRLGRPPKALGEKYRSISIKLHPRILAWARQRAQKQGIGYQTVINETLLHHTR